MVYKPQDTMLPRFVLTKFLPEALTQLERGAASAIVAIGRTSPRNAGAACVWLYSER